MLVAGLFQGFVLVIADLVEVDDGVDVEDVHVGGEEEEVGDGAFDEG